MTESVTPDSIHCFKVMLANHLDKDALLYLLENSIETIGEDVKKRLKNNKNTVKDPEMKELIKAEDKFMNNINDEIEVDHGSEPAIVVKVTQSQLYKAAFDKYGEEKDMQHVNFKAIKNMSDAIAKNLEYEDDWISDEAKSKRILQHYIPIALWLFDQVQIGASTKGQAVCVGLSIPQGAGRKKLLSSVELALEQIGIKTGIVSYDDFDMTHAQK